MLNILFAVICVSFSSIAIRKDHRTRTVFVTDVIVLFLRHF